MSGYLPLYPKTDLTPLPIGADPTKWVDASDWNVVANGARNIHNIAFYGAVSFSGVAQAPTVDCSPAFEAAIAAWLQGGGTVGGIYVPEGVWYISRPICLPSTCRLFGDGDRLSVIGPGLAGVDNPTWVQAFAGPLVWLGIGSEYDTHMNPVYVAPLVGSTGQAMKLAPFFAYWLHDSVMWTYVSQIISQLCLRFWITVTDLGELTWPDLYFPLGPPALECALIGSSGPQLAGINTVAPHGYFVDVVADPNISGNFFFRAYLTTSGNGMQVITSATSTAPGTYNVELDYNGSFFDFYIGGVNKGHLAATGTVVRQPWEGISIGWSGAEFNAIGEQSINGAIDSIELAQIARHTGTSSFTPPTAKYTADSYTLALINFDQGNATAGTPFLIGQSLSSAYAGSYTGWNPGVRLTKHYIRIMNQDAYNGIGVTAFAEVDNLQLFCSYQNAGLVGYSSPWCRIHDLEIFYPTSFGVSYFDPNSFYVSFKNIDVYASFSYGHLINALTADRMSSIGCPIGTQMNNGQIRDSWHEPFSSGANQTFIPFILGGSAQGVFAQINASGCDIDAEFLFPSMVCGMLAWSGGSFISTGNYWDSNGSNAPAVMYVETPPNGAIHIGDYFIPSNYPQSPCSVQLLPQSHPPAVATFINCLWNDTLPLTNTEGWITVFGPNHVPGTQTPIAGVGLTNISGISTYDVQPNNLAGVFQIIHGSTLGVVNFLTEEPDGNYQLDITAKSHTGSAPAASSTTVVGYTTTSTGFNVTIAADPAGTCILTFGWVLIRGQPPALLWVPSPAIPSTYTNPLATADPTGDWAVGISVVPVGNSFVYDSSAAVQSVVDCGTVSTANWWELSLTKAGQATYGVGSGTFTNRLFDSSVSNGKLSGLLCPGSHNLEFSWAGTLFTPLIDGVQCGNAAGYPIYDPLGAGTQQATIYVGERVGGTQPLTTVSEVRNLRVDPLLSRVIWTEPDWGPRAMAQAAFFGDSFTIGTGAAGAGVGGWASQIASARYGTTYYWFASVSSLPSSTLLSEFWSGAGLNAPLGLPWGAAQTLTGMSIWTGFEDLSTGATSASIMLNIRGIIEGTQSTVYFVPPIASTATLVINGVSFTATFATNATTTINNLITLINASGPTLALVTPTLSSNGYAEPVLLLTSVARGTASNGITTTSNLANSALVTGTSFPPPNAVSMTGAVNGAITNGVSTIVLCDIPPFGAASFWTAGIETQRLALNASILAYTGAGVVIADCDSTLRNPANHTNLLPAYDFGDGFTLNNAGNTAAHGLLNPLLP